MDFSGIEQMAASATTWFGQHRTGAVIVVGVLALLLAGLGWWLRRQRGRDPLGRFFDAAAVVVAIALSAEGMWEAATERLHLVAGMALLLFAFAELSMLRAARRARAKVDKGKRPGIYGLMVWTIAIGAGLIATSNAPNITEHLIRFGAPLLVAAQWWADLIDELREKQGRLERASSRWIWTPQRIGVEIGLLRPDDGDDLDEAFRNRRVKKMVRLAGRIDTGWQWRASRRKLRLRRLAQMADEEMLTEVRDRYLRGAQAETLILGARLAHPLRAIGARPADTQSAHPDEGAAHPAQSEPAEQISQVARPAAWVDAAAPRRGQVVMRRPVEPPEDPRDAAFARAVARVAQGEAVRSAARKEDVPESTLRTRVKQAEINGHRFETPDTDRAAI